MTSWAILTGEYPPHLGGVADYTRLVARGLAAAGDDVTVFAPGEGHARDAGVDVRALPDEWGPRSLAFVARALRERPGARLLVQYVPQIFGLRGVNLPFALWIASRREPVWVMFHEVYYPLRRPDAWRRHALGLAQYAMAAVLAGRADRAFVSILEWNDWIKKVNPLARAAEWLPIPSTIATRVAPGAAAAVRARHGVGDADLVIGYFGTVGATVAPYLEGALEKLGQGPARVLMVLGPRGPDLAERLRSRVRARIVAPGRLDGDDVAAHVAACDLLVVPQTAGVSSRRTSVMAALALGVPVVTNDGVMCHPIWRDGAVALAPDPSPDAIARAAEELIADPKRRADVGARGRALYEARFAIERTIETLRAGGP